MKKKKRRAKTIGEMTNSRGEWQINPITRVRDGKKGYNRKKEKHKLRRGDY
jgi:hypothetical protein